MPYDSLLNYSAWPVYKEEIDNNKPSFNWNKVTESPGFKYLFNKYSTILNKFRKVPAQHLFDLVRQLTDPFLSEFVEVTDNVDFLEVSTDFFNFLFWNTDLYVSYENLLEVSRENLIDEQEERLLEDFQIEDKPTFNLWYRDAKTPDKVYTFTHLKTGLQFERPDWQDSFICVNWDGRSHNSRFSDWFKFANRMAIEQELLTLMLHLTTKRLSIAGEVENVKSYENIISSIYNGNPFLKIMDDIHIKEMVYMGPSDYKDLQTAIHLGWDRALSELGRVANTNPKMERLTTGENYKDIVAVANRQRMTLNQLKLFALKAKDKWGVSLKFAVNGIPQRTQMEADVETESMETSPINGNFTT